MQLTGVIESGAGKGAYFMQVDWVVRQCGAKLGFTPFPGTLNVNLCDADLPKLGELMDAAHVAFVPDNPDFCAARVRPVSVQGIPAGVVLPSDEVRVHEHRVLEIIAPCSLKQALGLVDGDAVRIDANPAGHPAGQAALQLELYELAASAGALEGFVYDRPGLEAAAVSNWVRNLSAQHDELPAETRAAIQPGLNRTLGRAIHSLAGLFGEEHPHVSALRALLSGENGPASADDFEVDKAQKTARYSRRSN